MRAVAAGLAVASVRARPSAFVGACVTLTLSATVVTACVAVAVAAGAAPSSPAQADLADVGIAFSLLTSYLSMFVVGQVMSLAVAQRRRETALLRAVGAGPGQIRRMVAVETLSCAGVALPVGFGLGALLAHGWLGVLAAQGMLPDGMVLRIGLPPLLAAAGVVVAAAQLGGLLGAWRASRTRPGAALATSAVQGSERPGRVRAGASLLVLLGAVALTVAARSSDPADAGAQLPLVLIAYLVAIGLAGPWIGRLAAVVAAPLLVAVGGVSGELAVAGCRARSRRLSAAITPVALVTAFVVAKVASLAGGGPVDAMEVAGTLLYVGFAGLVATNTLVMLTLERLREFSLLRLVGAEPRQILAVVLAEGAVVTLAGVGTGALAACAVLLPLGPTVGTPLSGTPMWLWPLALGCGALLVGGASCAPLARMLRVPPLEGIQRRT